MTERILAAVLGGCMTLAAADINGTVVVERRLTRPKVTPSAPAYQRGVAVPLDLEDGFGPKPSRPTGV